MSGVEAAHGLGEMKARRRESTGVLETRESCASAHWFSANATFYFLLTTSNFPPKTHTTTLNPHNTLTLHQNLPNPLHRGVAVATGSYSVKFSRAV